MTALALSPAAGLSIEDLAALLDRSFEGYLVPIHITASALLTMIRRDGIDLDASRVILREERPIGLALIARRGWTSRLAAMGIAAAERSRGAGAWSMARLIEEARSRGEQRMELEVIEQNAAAVRLYRGAGFTALRRLAGYEIENPRGVPGDLAEVDIRAHALDVARRGLADLPWQLSAETLALHTPPARAFRLGQAGGLVSNPELPQVAIASVRAADGEGARLLQALFSRFPDKTWHAPAVFPEEMGGLFEAAGMRRAAISQWQMARPLV